MSEKTPDEEAMEAWEKGTPVDVKRVRPSTSVLSTRLPRDLFESLSLRAEAEGKPVSLLARELIESGLEAVGPQTPLHVATMFHRWTEEILQSFKVSTVASPAITQTSWIHVSSGAVPFEHTLENLLSDVRVGRVEHSSTAALGLVA